MRGLFLVMLVDTAISTIIDTRLSDIAIAKKFITTARSNIERQYLFQCAVLTIYASLEGGVKDIAGTILTSINTTSCKVCDLTPCYTTLALSKTCKLNQSISDHQKKINTTVNIVNAVLSRARLPISVDTESNLTPKVIEKICLMLDIQNVLINQDDENDLNILLRFRNNIAHGDRKMPIDFTRIDQLSGIAVKILCAVGSRISEAHSNKIWLARSP